MSTSRKTIPNSEWEIHVQLRSGAQDGFSNVLAQRTIHVVDSQRHNIGHLTQSLVEETFELLPNKGKRTARYGGKKEHA